MPPVKLLRLGLGLLGGLLILVAVSIDGLSAVLTSFGRAQALLVLLGATLIFVAGTWSKAGERFRDGAAMLVAAILLLMVVELAAGPAGRLFRSQPEQDSHGASVRREDLSYVAGTDWAASFWPEHRVAEAGLRYQPYVLWRTAPFDGALTTITPEGFRLTPGASCGGDAYRVFVFGGSTVWGWGVPDWGTIPAYLQEYWNAGSSPVCVVNMGQNGFVSTQELIALVRVLQQGQVPDLVIFYDGFNDVHAAFETETGRPGVHYAPERIAQKLEEVPPPSLLTQVLERSALVAMLGSFKAAAGSEAGEATHLGDPSADSLRASIVQTYLHTVAMVGLLAESYGFDYLVAWQPSIYSDAGGLNDEEREMYDRGMAIGFVPLLEAVRLSIIERVATDPHLIDLSHAFDTVEQPMWQDFVHPVPEGNRVIANHIAAAMVSGGLASGSPGP
jgi:lysophospholipase L1-like esterase